MKISAILPIISMALAASASAIPNPSNGSCDQDQVAACCILGVCVQLVNGCGIGNIAICCNNIAIVSELLYREFPTAYIVENLESLTYVYITSYRCMDY